MPVSFRRVALPEFLLEQGCYDPKAAAPYLARIATGEISASIGKLQHLYWLDLSDYKLSGSIPVSDGTKPGLDMLLHTKHLYPFLSYLEFFITIFLCPIDQFLIRFKPFQSLRNKSALWRNPTESFLVLKWF